MKISILWKIVLGVLAIAILAYLSFQYAIIAHFPTGDDPAVHIRNIQHSSFSALWSLRYPLPLVIFKFLSGTIHIGLPRLFTLVISGFFFFSTVAVFVLGRKVSNSMVGGFIAAALFSVGVWTTDGLRMGLLAESFGWGMLALTLYFLADKKLIWTIIFSGLLIISHPLAFFVYLICLFIYLVAGIITAGPERKFCLTLVGIYAVLGVGMMLARPSLVQHFLQFTNPENPDWGLQKLGDILTTGGTKRLAVAFFAVIGLVSSVGNWSRSEIKVLFALLFAGLFMSLSQIFGISFLVFRFFPYLEMSVVLLAAIGILATVKGLGLRNTTATGILPLCVALPMIWFNLNGTNTITRYQVTTPSADASMTQGDQEALTWISGALDKGTIIEASSKRGLWISALTEDSTYSNPVVYSQSELNAYWLSGNSMPHYIYYSPIDPRPASLPYPYSKVYERDGVTIYHYNFDLPVRQP